MEGTAAEPRWIPWRATIPDDVAPEVAEALGLVDVDAERAALLADVAGVEALADEVEALREAPAGSGLGPPLGSKLADRTWSTSQAVLRAGAVWYRTEERLSERELAARALGWSKARTPARREAFATLVGRPFDEALAVRERFLRVRGPIGWRFEGRDADARAARPVAGSARLVGAGRRGHHVFGGGRTGGGEPRAFEEVARRSDVPDSWVCVFGGGYVEDAVIQLLDRLTLPVAAWADIDPHGIAIVEDLAGRLGRPVTPIGMDPQWLQTRAARDASPEQISHARELSESTDDNALRETALAILDRRRVLEQESIQSVVIPDLPALLGHP